MDKKTEDYFTRNEDRLNRYLYMAYPIFITLIFLVIAFMIAFSAIGGNRLKAMKETMKSAEQLIAEGREVDKARGTIFEQLDKKRNELHDFIVKMREENEAEMDRFVDGLSGNIEHRMREVTMSLRQKAEKELDDTMKELRSDMHAEIRNSALELRDKVLADVGAQQKKFFDEVEAHTLFLEASFLFVNGKHEEALKIYRRLLALKPDHYVAWNNMGTIMRDLTRFDEALEAYQKALTISPENPGVLYNIAATYATMKKKDKMLALLKETVERDPEYGDEALNDKCFREYWGDADFKDIAEG
jgi:tetratricopeptide (TPR) repeat protein